MGMVNFYPEAGTIASSIGVVVFSTAIMFEFINFNHNIRMNYYDLLERQKKMDYTGNIAGSLIHEVKNANQIIKGFSSMLEQSETIQEKDHAFAEMISRSSQHLEELTENYKGYINASDVEYKMEDLEDIINESIQFSSEMLKKHHISVHFVNQITPLMAFANKANFKQVFINLLKNSMEATPLEKEERDIYIETKVENNKIIIDFKDSGKGIPPSNWESVFDPFISLEKRGMGFGLPFVKKIIIEHLGDISIVSSSSKGTTFRIEIPQMGSFSRKD